MNITATASLPVHRHKSIGPALNRGGGRLRRNSHGIALIVSMIILGVLALLGVTTMSATNTELRIAANLEEASRSFHAAEAGIDAARVSVFPDSDHVAFAGDTIVIDFTSLNPNPLANLDSDTPTVTAVPTGDPRGQCERSNTASSADLIACGAFDLISEHAPATSAEERNAAATSLRLGISQEVIASQ